MRRPIRGALGVVVLFAGACSGGDDDADSTVPTDPVAVTAAPTTGASTVPDPPTTPPTTAIATVATTPPVSELDALKAQIAADYVESAQRRRALTLNPSLDGLEARAATVAAPGSPDYDGLVALVKDLVANGERVVPGDPPYDETTVEVVEVDAPSATSATVTACIVFNEKRVGADGIPVGETGVLRAARISQEVERVELSWLPASAVTVIAADSGVTACPAK